MEIDRRAFIASLGGAAAVAAMDHEARADALEHHMEEQLDQAVAAQGQEAVKYPDGGRARSADRDAATTAAAPAAYSSTRAET